MEWLWRTLSNTFFTSYMKKGNTGEINETVEPTKWLNLLQDVKKSDCDVWQGSWMQCVGPTLGKNNQTTWSTGTVKLAIDKNGLPPLYDFSEVHYLNEQVKYIRELGNCIANLQTIFQTSTLWETVIMGAKPQEDFPIAICRLLWPQGSTCRLGLPLPFLQILPKYHLSLLICTIP